MKMFKKTALVVVSLLLSAGVGFAATPTVAPVQAPAVDLKGAAKSAGTAAKADAKATATAAKADVKATAADAKATAAAAKADAKGKVTATKADAKGKAAAVKAAATSSLVDINTASAAELKAVPGLSDALAAKIIAGRPYANKAQLKSRNIVPANVYDQMKEAIIAKKAAKK
jgi:DNA uptake protein ComE-like DNA-binding protein